MMKVGDKFEQDGKEYVAEATMPDDGSCKRCVFMFGSQGCTKAPKCAGKYDEPYGVHFVVVKK